MTAEVIIPGMCLLLLVCIGIFIIDKTYSTLGFLGNSYLLGVGLWQKILPFMALVYISSIAELQALSAITPLVTPPIKHHLLTAQVSVLMFVLPLLLVSRWRIVVALLCIGVILIEIGTKLQSPMMSINVSLLIGSLLIFIFMSKNILPQRPVLSLKFLKHFQEPFIVAIAIVGFLLHTAALFNLTHFSVWLSDAINYRVEHWLVAAIQIVGMVVWTLVGIAGVPRSFFIPLLLCFLVLTIKYFFALNDQMLTVIFSLGLIASFSINTPSSRRRYASD